MSLTRNLARRFAVALVIMALALPASAQDDASTLAEARERQTRNLVLGLAALAAVGLAIHARRDDDDDDRRLPGRCLADWPASGGTVRLYDPDCLDDEFGAASRLPLDCAVTVRSRGRFVSGFSPGCLRDEGWIIRTE